MKLNHFLTVTGVLFLIIGTLHLLRLIFKWSVAFNGGSFPLWPSAVALMVTYGLAFTAFGLKNKES